MPVDGRAGKIELFCLRDRAELLCRCQHAIVAHQRGLVDQTKRGCRKMAAELAAIAVHAVAGLGRHRQLMARFANSLLRGLPQRFGHRARIRTANCFALLFDSNHHLEGVRLRDAEYGAEQTNHKAPRGIFVVMKNDLNVARLNAIHRKLRKLPRTACLTNGNKSRTILAEVDKKISVTLNGRSEPSLRVLPGLAWERAIASQPARMWKKAATCMPQPRRHLLKRWGRGVPSLSILR